MHKVQCKIKVRESLFNIEEFQDGTAPALETSCRAVLSAGGRGDVTAPAHTPAGAPALRFKIGPGDLPVLEIFPGILTQVFLRSPWKNGFFSIQLIFSLSLEQGWHKKASSRGQLRMISPELGTA